MCRSVPKWTDSARGCLGAYPRRRCAATVSTPTFLRQWLFRRRAHGYTFRPAPSGYSLAERLLPLRRPARPATPVTLYSPGMISLTVNGSRRTFDGDPAMPLLWYLRDDLALTGTKYGCGVGSCGACTVHVEGRAVRSCQTKMSELDGRRVTTIEGLHPRGEHRVQVAWRDIDVPQCGYCQSGQIMKAAELLASTPRPTDQQIDNAMNGNICRCGTYPRIRAAIKAAAEKQS